MAEPAKHRERQRTGSETWDCFANRPDAGRLFFPLVPCPAMPCTPCTCHVALPIVSIHLQCYRALPRSRRPCPPLSPLPTSLPLALPPSSLHAATPLESACPSGPQSSPFNHHQSARHILRACLGISLIIKNRPSRSSPHSRTSAAVLGWPSFLHDHHQIPRIAQFDVYACMQVYSFELLTPRLT